MLVICMQNIYVLNDSVVFWPEKNILSDISDDSKRVQLTGPAARCLELLILRKTLVLQSELYEYAWKGSGVIPSPNTLYQSISVTRRAFREICANETDYILTETRKGFRLNPAVSVLAKMQDFPDVHPEKEMSKASEDRHTSELLNNIKGKLVRLKLMTFIIIAVIFSGMLTFEIYTVKTRGYAFFEGYRGPILIPGSTCNFFLSPQNDKSRLSDLNFSFLKCHYRSYIYVTILPYSPNISVISCDRVINSVPVKCGAMTLRGGNVFKK